jgi:hypothetical protein
LKPASSNIDQLVSVAMSACSVRRAMLPSATPGRKVPGSSTPYFGCRMRANASAPARHLRLRSILGWYHISNQPWCSASSISMRWLGSEVIELTSVRRSSSPSFSIGPDQRRGSGS